MRKITFISALSFMVLSLAACAGAGEPSQEEKADVPENQVTVSYDSEDSHNSIIVNSSEQVSVVPDVAEIVYSVRTQESSASGCQQKNAEAVGQVIELLKSLEVEEKSIQTSDYYMNPVYNYSGNTPKVTGYEAVTALTVSDLPIEGLDTVLSQSVVSGINTIQSITYQASKYDESYREALTKAVASAYEKAQVLAAASGCSVGSVVSIQETSGYTQARYTDTARSGMINSAKQMSLESAADEAAVMPGEIQVEAGIIVEYSLLPASAK